MDYFLVLHDIHRYMAILILVEFKLHRYMVRYVTHSCMVSWIIADVLYRGISAEKLVNILRLLALIVAKPSALRHKTSPNLTVTKRMLLTPRW